MGAILAVFTATAAAVCALTLIAVTDFSTRIEREAEDHPVRPPLMDHTAFGVGNEAAIEDRATWALRVLGKTNGTMIEAMLNKGLVASKFAPLTKERIIEVHQAQKEQNPTLIEKEVEPFPNEKEIMGDSAAGGEAAAPAAPA